MTTVNFIQPLLVAGLNRIRRFSVTLSVDPKCKEILMSCVMEVLKGINMRLVEKE